MHNLRTLPILNRPSRPSSPAPPSTQVSNATATSQPHTGLGVMQTASEPGYPRSRSLSRQVVDRVAALSVSQTSNTAKPPSVPPPALSAKNDPSPPASRAATPRLVTGALSVPAGEPSSTTPPSGHMEVVSLRLTEAVNKACAGIDWRTKKGFRKRSGWTIGESIVSELTVCGNDTYLIRAVLRTSVRAMSIYITRLESLLLPALTDSVFVAPLNLHAPSPSAHPLNAVQYFALSVAHASWETCEVLEQALETVKWPRFVDDTLRPIMKKFDLIVGKVVNPMMSSLKRDLLASLVRTEGLSPGSRSAVLPVIPAPTSAVVKQKEPTAASRLIKEVSSGGTPRSLSIPVNLQNFAARVDGARKILDIVAKPCADDGEGWVTSVAVTVIWKGMCVITEKDPSHGHRPPSPNSVARALNNLAIKEGANHLAVNTALTGSHLNANIAHTPTTPAALGGVTAKLTTMLPARVASRPPSPPRHNGNHIIQSIMSLESLIKRLVTGLVEPFTPSTDPTVQTSPEHIAREALHEALESLSDFRTVATAMRGKGEVSTRLLASARRIRDDVDDEAEEALDDAMEDTPAVLLFSLILRQANHALSSLQADAQHDSKLLIRHPAEIWGWSSAEYERQVLAGFGPANEWSKRVALALKPEIEEVMASLLHSGGSTKQSSSLVEATEWVKCLGVLCEARGGVMVPSAM